MGLWSSFRKRNKGASLFRLLIWEFTRITSGLWLILFYRMKTYRRENVPLEGPILLISNHQSFLDLTVIGQAVRYRHFHPMARKTLFRNKFFGWYITMLNAFEVDQDKGDIKAIRTAIDRLKQDHLVLVFPEGARTEDGKMGDIQPGVMLILKRAKPTILPMAVDGVWDVYPPGGKLKKTGGVGAIFGEPIPSEKFLEMSNDDALVYMKKVIESLRVELRGKLREASNGKFPPPGPGDSPCLPIDDLDTFPDKSNEQTQASESQDHQNTENQPQTTEGE